MGRSIELQENKPLDRGSNYCEEAKMKITYDAFDKTGIAETYIISVSSLQDSSKDYLGDLVYDVLEGDMSLLDEFQRVDMEIYCSQEYVRWWNDYMKGV